MIFQHKIKHLVRQILQLPILPFVIILLAAIVAIVVFVKKRFGGKKS